MDWNLKDLEKSSSDIYVVGICGGLGEHTPVPAWLWRVAFVLLGLSGGAGLAVYAVLWYFMPESREGQDSDAAA